ncbi:MAG: patatin-like phospholipase family protein [Chlamydiales bacterium]|nr:patatin-like phospholipase family protein [Chlamydiales bacterium]
MLKSFFHTILLLLVACTGCCPHLYHPADCPEQPEAFEVPERIRVALVLGSGGVRGMAHVGVLEELENAGIPIDLIVGCSAGSIVGALYADNPDISSIKHAVWGIRSQSMFDLDVWNCRFGLSQDRSMYRVLRKHLCADTFEDLKIPLVIVASDLHTAELVPMGSGCLLKAVQASCSIPFVFVPCEHLGRILVDGGVINPVPVKVARDLGAEVIIAVDLCEMLPSTFPTNLFQVAKRSAEIAFMWQNEGCTRGATVVIRPKTCGVGCFNDEMKAQIYEAGKSAARDKMACIKECIAPYLDDSCKGQRTRCYQPCCYTPRICLD